MLFQKDILAVTDAKPICDLVDFFKLWPELKGKVEAVIERPDLDACEREVLVWLSRLADRVGPDDLTRD
jgi:hypothetical protein